ncbi:MAG TPA: GntR family transcriptional regulator [Allosphingosinicella sp.]
MLGTIVAMADDLTALAPRGPSGAEVADWIRNMIRNRRFVPGQRLVEVEIIRQTGGSRSKVREAFQRLEAEGLVTLEEFRGASVRSASMDEVLQVYRARSVLEGACAADCARNASPELLLRLLNATAEIEECVESNRGERFGRLNARWHGLIMEGSGNFVMKGLVQRLATPLHHLLFEVFYNGERLKAAAADHRAILSCIQARDPDAAEKAMRQHVENGFKFLAGLDRAYHLEDETATPEQSNAMNSHQI